MDMLDVNGIRYHVKGLLSEGGFAKVYRVETEDGRQLVLKQINTFLANRCNMAVCEIQLLKFLANRCEDNCRIAHLVDFSHINLDSPEQQFNLLLDYVDGQELIEFIEQHLETLTTGDKYRLIKRLAIDILRTLSWLHRNGVIHRDLKLENILVHRDADTGNYHCTLIDFNLSCCLDPKFLEVASSSQPQYVGDLAEDLQGCYKTVVGSRHYVAVEAVTYQLRSVNDLKAGDIWSFGVILYSMLYGHFPFSNSMYWVSLINYNTGFAKWKTKLRNKPTPFNHVLNNIFVALNKRPSADDLIKMLEHVDCG